MSFMSEPAKVFRAYLEATAAEEKWYQYGMLAMALEIITRIKVLEDLPVTTEVGRQEAITVLHTMLTEMGLSDIAYEWYDQLSDWRKPKFRPTSLFERLEHALEGAVVSDDPGGPLHPDPQLSDEPASDPEARPSAPSPLGSAHAPSVVHQSPDAPTTSEQAVSTASVWQRRHSE